jgi:hypothetical protein
MNEHDPWKVHLIDEFGWVINRHDLDCVDNFADLRVVAVRGSEQAIEPPGASGELRVFQLDPRSSDVVFYGAVNTRAEAIDRLASADRVAQEANSARL